MLDSALDDARRSGCHSSRGWLGRPRRASSTHLSRPACLVRPAHSPAPDAASEGGRDAGASFCGLSHRDGEAPEAFRPTNSPPEVAKCRMWHTLRPPGAWPAVRCSERQSLLGRATARELAPAIRNPTFGMGASPKTRGPSVPSGP